MKCSTGATIIQTVFVLPLQYLLQKGLQINSDGFPQFGNKLNQQWSLILLLKFLCTKASFRIS